VLKYAINHKQITQEDFLIVENMQDVGLKKEVGLEQKPLKKQNKQGRIGFLKTFYGMELAKTNQSNRKSEVNMLVNKKCPYVDACSKYLTACKTKHYDWCVHMEKAKAMHEKASAIVDGFIQGTVNEVFDKHFKPLVKEIADEKG